MLTIILYASWAALSLFALAGCGYQRSRWHAWAGFAGIVAGGVVAFLFGPMPAMVVAAFTLFVLIAGEEDQPPPRRSLRRA